MNASLHRRRGNGNNIYLLPAVYRQVLGALPEFWCLMSTVTLWNPFFRWENQVAKIVLLTNNYGADIVCHAGTASQDRAFEMAPGRARDQGTWRSVVVRVWAAMQMSLGPPSPLKSELTLLQASVSVLFVRKAPTLTSHVDRKPTIYLQPCWSLTGWLGFASCSRIHLGL